MGVGVAWLADVIELWLNKGFPFKEDPQGLSSALRQTGQRSWVNGWELHVPGTWHCCSKTSLDCDFQGTEEAVEREGRQQDRLLKIIRPGASKMDSQNPHDGRHDRR